MSKIYCVYSLISLLSEGKKKQLSELSRQLEISPAMVRRYIAELEKLGIYVESIRGRYGGYYLAESYYKIPILPFDQSDINILENLKKTNSNNKEINIILSKIKKYVCVNNEREPIFENDNIRKMYNDFNKAIKDNRKIYIEYYAIYENKLGSRDYTKRIFIPDEIFFFEKKWMAHGYCELRKDIRQFEFDRIRTYKIL